MKRSEWTVWWHLAIVSLLVVLDAYSCTGLEDLPLDSPSILGKKSFTGRESERSTQKKKRRRKKIVTSAVNLDPKNETLSEINDLKESADKFGSTADEFEVTEEKNESSSKSTDDETVDEYGSDLNQLDDKEKDISESVPKASVAKGHGPVPLFNFPPRPGIKLTAAEHSLQDQLPVQQRLMTYFTDDKLFAVQLLGSLFFATNAVNSFILSEDASAYQKVFQSSLLALVVKYWCIVIQRFNKVLIPHLTYEPTKYELFLNRVSRLSRDPSVQVIVYCSLFLTHRPFLKISLLPLVFREVAYILLVLREIVRIVSPGLYSLIHSLLKWPLSSLLYGGNVKKWSAAAEVDRQTIISRKLAQVCYKLEMLVMCFVLMKGLPQALTSEKQVITVALFLLFIGIFSRLLQTQNELLNGDICALKDFKVGALSFGWTEIFLDSYMYSTILRLPKSVACIIAVFQTINFKSLESLYLDLKSSDRPIVVLAGKLIRGAVKDEMSSSDSDEKSEEEEEKEEEEKNEEDPGVLAIALGLAK